MFWKDIILRHQPCIYTFLKHVCQAIKKASYPGKGRASLAGSVVKNLPASAGDAGSVPRSGRSPWRRKRQFTPADWRATHHGGAN